MFVSKKTIKWALISSIVTLFLFALASLTGSHFFPLELFSFNGLVVVFVFLFFTMAFTFG